MSVNVVEPGTEWSADTVGDLCSLADSGEDPALADTLLADTRFLARAAEPPDPPRALLIAAIACEVKICLLVYGGHLVGVLCSEQRARSTTSASGRVLILRDPWAKFTFASEEWRAELARIVDEQQVDIVIAGPLSRIGMEAAGRIT
jgi:hypothetical protein